MVHFFNLLLKHILNHLIVCLNDGMKSNFSSVLQPNSTFPYVSFVVSWNQMFAACCSILSCNGIVLKCIENAS